MEADTTQYQNDRHRKVILLFINGKNNITDQ